MKGNCLNTYELLYDFINKSVLYTICFDVIHFLCCFCKLPKHLAFTFGKYRVVLLNIYMFQKSGKHIFHMRFNSETSTISCR